MRIHLISLGCARNLVDSERLTSQLGKLGYSLTPDLSDAGLVIVNTCGFVDDAKKESIATILDVLSSRNQDTPLVVFGCLIQRYEDELRKELPEVDLLLPIMPADRMAAEIARRFPPDAGASTSQDQGQVLFTPPSYRYIKIADGCVNNCSYCAIPLIRGPLTSVPRKRVLADVKQAIKDGVRELDIIAQDITAYGSDLYGSPSLIPLIRDILALPSDFRLRLLYAHPARIDRELARLIASDGRIIPYLDVPLQHVSPRILALMDRTYDHAATVAFLEETKAAIPGLTLRTSLIVGFPGETEDEYSALCSFASSGLFDHVGLFEYSPEDGTKAATLPGRVPPREIRRRKTALMKSLRRSATLRNRQLKGAVLPCIVEQPHDELGAVWTGRLYSQAPEIDGQTFIVGYEPSMGTEVTVQIRKAIGFDLVADVR